MIRTQYASIVKHYLPYLPESRDAKILDFGSGRGVITDFLLGQGYTGVAAFERDERERARLSKGAAAVTTFGADHSKFLRERACRWDAVILKDVLYYFDDPSALVFLNELREFMQPGGVLIVEIFNGACLTAPYVLYKDRGIRRVFTEHSLASVLEEAGFSREVVCGIRPAVRGPVSLAFFLLSRAWQLVLRGIYLAERGIDSQNPSTLEKRIVLVAKAPL